LPGVLSGLFIFIEKAENVPMPGSYRTEKWQEIFAPNPAMLRHQMTVEGYDVFQWSDQPGVEYGSHMHGEEQSHWIISGSLELSVQGIGTFVLEAGDRDFMPAGTYHSARVLGEEPVMYLIGAKR
jgi:mannose-6-phosphate isomerase-like protein (cupin superfamily)